MQESHAHRFFGVKGGSVVGDPVGENHGEDGDSIGMVGDAFGVADASERPSDAGEVFQRSERAQKVDDLFGRRRGHMLLLLPF